MKWGRPNWDAVSAKKTYFGKEIWKQKIKGIIDVLKFIFCLVFPIFYLIQRGEKFIFM